MFLYNASHLISAVDLFYDSVIKDKSDNIDCHCVLYVFILICGIEYIYFG